MDRYRKREDGLFETEKVSLGELSDHNPSFADDDEIRQTDFRDY